MRELSETEKQVIIRLVEWEQILKEQPHNYFQMNLSTLLRELCEKYNSSFDINFKTNEIILKSTNKLNGSGLAENNLFRRDFISIVHFLDYLKKEKLVFLVPIDPDVNDTKHTYSYLISKKSIFISRINDKKFITLFSRLFSRDIYTTEYLTKYYANDCKSDEEVRFHKSIKIANEGVEKARTSIKVAICIGIATILMTFFALLKPNTKTQLILNRIDKLEEKTDRRFIELENRINFRFDSINTKIKKFEYEIFEGDP